MLLLWFWWWCSKTSVNPAPYFMQRGLETSQACLHINSRAFAALSASMGHGSRQISLGFYWYVDINILTVIQLHNCSTSAVKIHLTASRMLLNFNHSKSSFMWRYIILLFPGKKCVNCVVSDCDLCSENSCSRIRLILPYGVISFARAPGQIL